MAQSFAHENNRRSGRTGFPAHVNRFRRCPSIRMALGHHVDAWHIGIMSATEVLLVARRHIDLRRVSSAICRRTR
jgi:hypothetical protein